MRLADVNGDGRLDVATGWEEGGVIRACLHPGFSKAKEKWPAVTIGKVRSPEDAVFVDLDGDGATDVVSCCEGKTRSVFVHWAPKDPSQYLQANAWQTEAMPGLQGKAMWMFCAPAQVDGEAGVDLILGAKGRGAEIGWLQAPADAHRLEEWKWRPLRRAGWIMSLEATDMDGDGDPDVLASDRKGALRRCLWLENPGPGPEQTEPWPEHVIGGEGKEVMFLCQGDLDADGMTDVLVTTYDREIFFFRRESADGRRWRTCPIDMPANTGSGKAVRIADVDLDGRGDIVLTCGNASKGKSAVVWLSRSGAATDPRWQAHEISGPEGVKFDLVQTLDLDGDGDLDCLTCEERTNLGVFWYENPLR